MAQYLIIPDRERIEQSLALAKQYGLGFEFNDFFFPRILDDEKKKEEIATFYDGIDMPGLLTTHGDFFDVLIFSEDPEIVKISEKRIRQSLDVALRVHAKAVILHTNYEPLLTQEYYRKVWRDRNEEFFRAICSEYPTIQIYMENMFDKDPSELKMLCDSMKDVSNFGVCLDYAHAFVFGTGAALDEWVGDLSEYIRHVHINDNDGKGDLHLAVGDGIIDWEEFVKLRKQYFPDATVLVETTPLDRQEKSLKFMKENGFFE